MIGLFCGLCSIHPRKVSALRFLVSVCMCFRLGILSTFFTF